MYGHPSPPAGTWRDHLVWDERSLIQKETHPRDPRGKEAISHYRVLEPLEGAALIEVRLVTGRRNQIRIQARLRGHTLVGEQRYTYGPDTLRSIAFPRQALHAHRLAFKHPVDGRELRFEAPLPPGSNDLIAATATSGRLEGLHDLQAAVNGLVIRSAIPSVANCGRSCTPCPPASRTRRA